MNFSLVKVVGKVVVLGNRDILVVGKVVVLGQKWGRFQKNPLVTLKRTKAVVDKLSQYKESLTAPETTSCLSSTVVRIGTLTTLTQKCLRSAFREVRQL